MAKFKCHDEFWTVRKQQESVIIYYITCMQYPLLNNFCARENDRLVAEKSGKKRKIQTLVK